MSDKNQRNADPITNESGAHPIGTGVGATGGAVAGATVGAVAGPIGAAVGAAVGAVVGGLAGKGTAEVFNPTIEEAYWRENYRSDASYVDGYIYEDDYLPAYRIGYEGRNRYKGSYVDHELEMLNEWRAKRGKSRLTDAQVKTAIKNAWNRVENTVERAIPGDSDGDGR